MREVVESAPQANGSVQELPDYCQGVYDRTLKLGGGGGGAASAAGGGQTQRNVVVLGAGMCAAPAVEYLSRERSTKVRRRGGPLATLPSIAAHRATTPLATPTS